MNRFRIAVWLLLIAVCPLRAEGSPGDLEGARIFVREKVIISAGETIPGDLIALGGSIRIKGRVLGSVFALDGPIFLESTASVDRDIIALRGKIARDPGARVGGEVILLPLSKSVSASPDAGTSPKPSGEPQGILLTILLLIVLSGMISLILPGPLQVVGDQVERRTMASFAAGLFGIPACLACMVITIPTIFLPLLMLEGMALSFLYGWLAVAFVVGRPLRPGGGIRSPFWRMTLGSLALFLFLLLLGFIPGLGGLLFLLSVLFILLTGFGATLLTAFGLRPGWLDEMGRKRSPGV